MCSHCASALGYYLAMIGPRFSVQTIAFTIKSPVFTVKALVSGSAAGAEPYDFTSIDGTSNDYV